MKRRVLICSVMIVAFGLTILAFLPHYGCACGEIQKVNGSQLEYLPQTIAEFLLDVIDAIF